MTVQELLDLFFVLTDDPNEDNRTRQQALVLLNVAQNELQNEIDEADEGYFAASQDYSVTAARNSELEFDLPTDFKKLTTLERITSGRPVPGSPVMYQTRHDDTQAEIYAYQVYGPRYCLHGQKLVIVDPKDDYTARLHYTKKLPDLTSDSTTPEFPAEHLPLLALHGAKLSMGSDKEQFTHADEYERSYNRMMRSIEARKRQKPRYVKYVYY